MLINIIAVVIILASAGVAYYKGFVKTFFGFISTIVALVLAVLFCKPVATLIKDNTQMDEWIIESIVSIASNDEKEKLKENNSEKNKEYVKDGKNEGKDIEENFYLSYIDNLPDLISSALDYEDKKEETYKKIANTVSDVLINIMSWIIIYLVVRVIIMILTFVFNGIMNLPILRSINNLAGLALGVIMGIYRIYLILAIIYFLSGFLDMNWLIANIKTSGIIAQMYDNNLIINLIF